MELTAYVYYKYRLFCMPFGKKNNILILPTTVTILKNKVINNKVIINQCSISCTSSQKYIATSRLLDFIITEVKVIVSPRII